MTLRRTALGLLSSLTLLGGLLAAPASAAPATTVTLRVVDSGNQPIAGITVLAFNESFFEDIDDDDFEEFEDEDTFKGFVQFGDTNADGNIIKSRGNYPTNQLTGGSWTFVLGDSDDVRRKAGTSYATASKEVELTSGTENALGDIALEDGSSITGVAKAPSGKVLKNLGVEIASPGDDDFLEDYDETSSTGRFTFAGLAPQTYRLSAYRDLEQEDDSVDAKASVKITGTGQHKTANISNFKVRCTNGLSLSSPSKGVTTIRLRTEASDFGISKPRGTMKLYRDGKLIRDFAWSGPTKTITLKNQTTGRKFTYKAVHTDGDCLKWFTTKTVTVKK